VSRDLSVGMASHLASATHTRCRMLRLALNDGTVIAVTDHDRALSYDIGAGVDSYSPRTGITASDLALSTGFGADDVEVTGPLVEVATEPWHVTKAAILGGRFDDAVAHFFQVNWKSLGSGAIKLQRGYVVLPEVVGSRFKLTINSEISKFAQETGRLVTPYCENDYGVGFCDRTRIEVAATVTAVTNDRLITVSFAGAYADNFFNKGTVLFTSGALIGTRPVEISDWSAAGAIVLWTELAQPPEIGDTLTLRQGCYDPATGVSKTRAACMVMGGDALPFRGFPDVPGTDQVLKYPNPGG
jgi:uncharacterized phage protein (TIGR02218 family)